MNFSEISGIKQWALLLGAAALLNAALYFTYFKSQREANATGYYTVKRIKCNCS